MSEIGIDISGPPGLNTLGNRHDENAPSRSAALDPLFSITSCTLLAWVRLVAVMLFTFIPLSRRKIQDAVLRHQVLIF